MRSEFISYIDGFCKFPGFILQFVELLDLDGSGLEITGLLDVYVIG